MLILYITILFWDKLWLISLDPMFLLWVTLFLNAISLNLELK